MSKLHELKNVLFFPGALCLCCILVASCSAAVNVDNAREDDKEVESAAVNQEREDATDKEKAEVEARRDALQAEYSSSAEPPLYVEKPLAWFGETDEMMLKTRKKLLAAQAKIAQIYGKYERMLQNGDDKAKGYLVMLEDAEKVRVKGQEKGWPVAFGQWVMANEEELDIKIQEIKRQMEKNGVLGVQDTAMFNAARDARKNARIHVTRFDEDYQEFQRVWDMVKLGELKGIPVELEKEIKAAMDITDIYVTEWNKVK